MVSYGVLWCLGTFLARQEFDFRSKLKHIILDYIDEISKIRLEQQDDSVQEF